MITNCCVKDCFNYVSYKKNVISEKVRFFRIPHMRSRFQKEYQELIEKQRTAWFTALNRKDITKLNEKKLRICSKHFILGMCIWYVSCLKRNIFFVLQKCCFEIYDPKWVPSLHLGYERNGISPKSRMKKYKRSMARMSYKRALFENTADESHQKNDVSLSS